MTDPRRSGRPGRPLLALGAGVALLGLTGPPPAGAAPREETASGGPVTATLSYEEPPRDEVGFRNVRVRIERAGVVLVDARIEKECSFCLVMPAGGGSAAGRSIYVRDLEADSEPEVMVDLFTGGAYCCFYTLVWRFDGTGYRRSKLMRHGNFPYEARNLDRRGPIELKSHDQRFAYRYGAHAETPRPLRIFRFLAGRLIDVTRRFRSEARGHAAQYYRTYLHVRRQRNANVRGWLAAYVADEYSAGRGRIGWRRLMAAYRRGEVDRQSRFESGPFGRAYVRDLRRFLRRTGYTLSA